jgi:putative peptide maturation system protein
VNNIWHQLSLELIEELLTLAETGAEPEQALERFRALRAKYPGAGLELVWERDRYDDRSHYDALLALEGRGTLSLAFCPDRGLPWPLRGVQRWSEFEMLRVNQTLLRVDEAIDMIDFIWNEAPILRRLIDTCLIREALDRDPIEVSDDELQAMMNDFRRTRGLLSPDAMVAWMAENGIDQLHLEQHLEWEAKVSRLRRTVAEGAIEDELASRRSSFDVAHAAELSFDRLEEAERVADELRAGRGDFFEHASRSFVERGRGALFVKHTRGSLGALFDVPLGAIVGPVPKDREYRIYRVLAVRPAELDDSTRELIERELFDRWLEKKRRTARIEWNWGMNPDRPADEQIRPYR